MPTDLPKPIETFLADFVARRRRLALGKAAALALSAALLILLLSCTADRFLHLPGTMRAALLASDLIAVVLILRRPAIEALHARANWIEAAHQIEQIEPAFAQRLITVTSQLQSPQAYRGSSGMLSVLLADVSNGISNRRGGAVLRWRQIKRPLVLAACILAITFSALVIPWLQFPRLLARFTRPWADIAPATTTQLAVLPGSTMIAQGGQLHVSVIADSIGEGAVQVHVQQADGWTIVSLNPTLEAEHFTGDLPPIDRDTHYFITGGDAQSEPFAVHVLTVPGLEQLRARIVYPAYLKWPDKSLVIADNKLELPVGSAVTLSIIGTEPLQDAAFTPAGDKPLPSAATVDPSVRTAAFTVSKDLIATIKLRSAQGVEQAVAQPIAIKSIPDRPPIVRLLTTTQDLRLSPTDVLTTAGQALDDYGVEQLALQIKINDRSPTQQPIAITGDVRRIETPITCDLSTLGVHVGDVLQFTLLAKDGAGQQQASETLRAIVSPTSFDMNAYLRLAELRTAKSLADILAAQMTGARDSVSAPPEALAKDGDRALSQMAASAHTAQLLMLSFMRAATRSDREELGDALAAWMDSAEQARAVCEELQDERARQIDPGRIAGLISMPLVYVQRTAAQLDLAVRQEQALAIRNDVSTIKDLTDRAAKAAPADRDRLLGTAARMRSDLAARASAINVRLDESNGVMTDLENLIAQARNAQRENVMINFIGVAGDLAGQLRSISPGRLIEVRTVTDHYDLSGRLAAASQLEMVRPDADFGRARDWSLAARATSKLTIASLALDVPATIQSAVQELPPVIRALNAEHQLHRTKPAPANADAVIKDAQIARDKLTKWLGEQDSALAKADDATDQALTAAAADQQRKFDQAKALDESRSAASKSEAQKKLQSAAKRNSDIAERLEMIRQRQQQLSEQTAAAVRQAQQSGEQKAAGEQQLQSLARQQAALAKSIQAMREEDSKSADAEQTEAEKAVDPVAAIADTRKALQQLARDNDAMRNSRDNTATVADAAALDAGTVDAANRKLADAVPEATDARKQIDEQVLAKVRQIQQDARGHDAGAATGHGNELNDAIKVAQAKLDAAEERLADRDALAAAQSAAQQASDQLQQATPPTPKTKSDDESKKGEKGDAKSPGGSPTAGNPSAPAAADPNAAGRQASAATDAQQAQGRTLSALERAVDQATGHGGQARVRELPGIDSLFSLLPFLAEGTSAGGGGAKRPAIDSPSLREWGKLRPREDQGQTAVAPQSDPAGYEQSLKLYFETLGKPSE